MQRNLILFLSLITLTAAAIAPAGMAQQGPSPAERTLLQLANQRRAEHGIAPLAWDPALARAARIHANWIIRARSRQGQLSHQYPGEPDLITRTATSGAHFSTVAENIADGGNSVTAIEAKWMNTPVHRANILDPHLTVVGIGVAEERGTLYAVQDFGRAVPVLRKEDVVPQVRKLLLDQGIRPAPSTADAQRNCELSSTTVGHPLLVIHWEGSDLTQIPDTVLRQMPAARSHTAAVATCPAQQPENAGFTTYRVVVLMY
jgi:hypothetical protein